MIIDFFWILYYRLQCMRVTINAIFYHFITFNAIKCLDNIGRLILWIILLVLITPLELIVVLIVDWVDNLGISNEQVERIKTIMRNTGTKDDIKQEYEDYQKFIWDEEK